MLRQAQHLARPPPGGCAARRCRPCRGRATRPRAQRSARPAPRRRTRPPPTRGSPPPPSGRRGRGDRVGPCQVDEPDEQQRRLRDVGLVPGQGGQRRTALAVADRHDAPELEVGAGGGRLRGGDDCGELGRRDLVGQVAADRPVGELKLDHVVGDEVGRGGGAVAGGDGGGDEIDGHGGSLTESDEDPPRGGPGHARSAARPAEPRGGAPDLRRRVGASRIRCQWSGRASHIAGWRRVGGAVRSPRAGGPPAYACRRGDRRPHSGGGLPAARAASAALADQDQVVAVDELAVVARAQLARAAPSVERPSSAGHLLGVVGDQPARDQAPSGPTSSTGSPASNVALDAGHPGRQQRGPPLDAPPAPRRRRARAVRACSRACASHSRRIDVRRPVAANQVPTSCAGERLRGLRGGREHHGHPGLRRDRDRLELGDHARRCRPRCPATATSMPSRSCGVPTDAMRRDPRATAGRCRARRRR